MIIRFFKLLKDNWEEYIDYIEFGDDVYPDEEPNGQTLKDKIERAEQIFYTILGKIKKERNSPMPCVYSISEENLQKAEVNLFIDFEKSMLEGKLRCLKY
jgi:hypothetical protein